MPDAGEHPRPKFSFGARSPTSAVQELGDARRRCAETPQCQLPRKVTPWGPWHRVGPPHSAPTRSRGTLACRSPDLSTQHRRPFLLICRGRVGACAESRKDRSASGWCRWPTRVAAWWPLHLASDSCIGTWHGRPWRATALPRRAGRTRQDSAGGRNATPDHQHRHGAAVLVVGPRQRTPMHLGATSVGLPGFPSRPSGSSEGVQVTASRTLPAQVVQALGWQG